ncbi:MAG: MopE-related protein [Myxococcota bacterium]
MSVRAAVLALVLLALSAGRAAVAAPGDQDGDGVPDATEDRDADGNLDDTDSDDDGTPDYLDVDDDGDGVDTRAEDFDGDGDPTNDDLDEDDRPDYLDTTSPLDVDNDDYVSAEYGGDDCDDTRNVVHPGAFDPWYDGQDWDCAGDDDYDADGDGYQNGYQVDGGTDCDDDDPSVHPGVTEDRGEVDRDCDGWSDPRGVLVANGGCDCGSSGAGASAPWWLAAVVVGRRRR